MPWELLMPLVGCLCPRWAVDALGGLMMPSVGYFCPRWAVTPLEGCVVPLGLLNFLFLCGYTIIVPFALFQMCFHMEPS